MGILSDLSKNPSFLLIAGIGVALFVFRDKISEFTSAISGGAAAAGTAGEITQTALDTLAGNQKGLIDALENLNKGFGQFQTDVNTNFGLINQGFGQFQTDVGNQFSGLGNFFTNLFNQNKQQEEKFDIDPSSQDAIDNPLNIVDPPFVQKILPQGFNEQVTGVSFGTEVIVPAGDEFGIGGGSGFIGGVTTFGDNLVDTLGEVLQAFPNLSASQAANLLADNQGLTQSQFKFINPFGSSSISSAGVDPDQIFNNSSGGFSGLTPTQIAQLLTGGNISNF